MKLFHFFFILLLGIFSSCSKNFLDKQPDDMLTMDQVFSNRLETEKYLANVYSYIPDPFNAYTYVPWEGASDELDFVWVFQNTNQLNQGNLSPTSAYFDNWGTYYRGIRSATVFLSRVDECKELTATQITNYKAEVRFLRAYYYFLLMRQYGPVVLIKELIPVYASSADVQLPRNAYDECVDYVVSELDEAWKTLPVQITDTKFYGKPTKGAALALKARLLLYAASPLFNGNADYASFKNTDGKQLINTTYDAGKWKKCAVAAKQLIDMNQYELYKKLDENGQIDPFLSYRDLFLDKWNKETIFARPVFQTEMERQYACRQVNGSNGAGITQQQVDAYQMANGKLISEQGSGYVEEGFSASDGKYTTKGTWNMYVNREPRFYASVAYNGSTCIYTAGGAFKIELYGTGLSGKLNGGGNYSTTGYLVRKNMSPNSDIQNDRYDMRPWMFFRLGEVYLNYAEALNECEPGNADIAKYVNLIRQRAGLPALAAGLPQDQMRTRIRAERRVELAFENLRFFDTRRWKVAMQTDGGKFWGMDVNAGTSFTDAAFYKRTVFETREFEQKNYLFPINQAEMDRNRNMVQNPGY